MFNQISCKIQSADNDNLASIVEELEYIEFAITGDTSLWARRSFHDNKRQINGDEILVDNIDYDYYNLSPDVLINIAKLIGSVQISDYYYYDVSKDLFKWSLVSNISVLQSFCP